MTQGTAHPSRREKDADDSKAILFPGFDVPSAVKDLVDVSDQAIWSVSSAKHGSGVLQLRDGNPETFWQSDGAQPHTITLQFRQLTEISVVALALNFSVDESYTPKKIAVQCCSNPTETIDVGEAEVDSPTGWLLIKCFEDFASKKDGPKVRPFARTLKIIVLENHQNGRDTHIRGMAVYGPKPIPIYKTAAYSMGYDLR
jgi:anaphase-promoting complex subunit 10